MNRVPEQLGVWRAPPASISRSSSSSSDSGEPVEEEEVKVEGDVSTGTSKPKTTGALKPYQMGETSIQLLPKGTGSATDGGEDARQVHSQCRSKQGHIVRGGMRQVATVSMYTTSAM